MRSRRVDQRGVGLYRQPVASGRVQRPAVRRTHQAHVNSVIEHLGRNLARIVRQGVASACGGFRWCLGYHLTPAGRSQRASRRRRRLRVEVGQDERGIARQALDQDAAGVLQDFPMLAVRTLRSGAAGQHQAPDDHAVVVRATVGGSAPFQARRARARLRR